MIKQVIIVGIGGFLGSAARYMISNYITAACPSGIPWGTFAVNATGSLIIGTLLAFARSGNWYYLAVIGFCGGFTTFSTFSAELVQLVRNENYAIAAGYAIASVLICMLAVAAGLYIGEKINIKL